MYVLQQYSCDGFTALPIDIQGTEYYAIGWENDGSIAQSMIGKHQYIMLTDHSRFQDPLRPGKVII